MANKTISELPDFGGIFGNGYIPIVDTGIDDPNKRNCKITGARLLQLLIEANSGAVQQKQKFFSAPFFGRPFFPKS